MTEEHRAVAVWRRRWQRRGRRVAGRCVDAMRQAPPWVEVVWGVAWSHQAAMLHAWGIYDGGVVDPTVAQLGASPVGYAELLDEGGQPLRVAPMWEPLRLAERLVLRAGARGEGARRWEELRPFVGRTWHTEGALPMVHALCAWWECARDFSERPTVLQAVIRWQQMTAATERGAA